MSEYLEKQKREDQRLEAEKLQKKQLFAQRVAAAASVASAVSAAQTAAEVERMRREASVAAETTALHQRVVEIQQAEMAARQEQMAEEQRTTNFRQTILTTLPLLKDGEKSQYLIEQLLPGVEKRYENEVGDKVFGDILKVFKFPDFAQNYFATEPDVKKFMIEGKNPKHKLNEATAAYKKTNKELEKVKGSTGWILPLVLAMIIAAVLVYCLFPREQSKSSSQSQQPQPTSVWGSNEEMRLVGIYKCFQTGDTLELTDGGESKMIKESGTYQYSGHWHIEGNRLIVKLLISVQYTLDITSSSTLKMRLIQYSDDAPKDIDDGDEYVRLNHEGGVQESSGEAYVREAKAKADAQAKEAHAKEVQAKEAQAKAHAQINKLVILLSSLTVLAFVFIKQKKISDAAQSKKVSDLSAKLSALKSEMDMETEIFESWSKSQPETWKNIKTNLVDSYLASTYGKILIKYDMAGELLKPFWLRCVNPEQAFLPPSARPSDEQWLLALKPKIDAENELLKQRQSQIRGVLLSRLAPNYETQQYDMDDLDEKFIDLDLEKTDASSDEPMSEKEINEKVASLTEEIKAIEAGPADEFLSAIKEVSSNRLEYLRSAIATGSPALPSAFLKIGRDKLDRLLVENAEKMRLLKARHPEKFS